MPTIYHLYNTAFFRNKPAPSLNVPSFEQITQPQDLMRADCVVVHIPSILLTNEPDHLVNLRKIVPTEQVWVAQTHESAENYTALNDPAFMALFDIEISYRQKADIWTPYIPWNLKTDYASIEVTPRKRQCCAFVSSHIDKSKRQTYMRELMQRLEVHSYGKFMRNKRILFDRGGSTKMRVMKKYTFAFAFENAIEPDYVTEKFFQPLMTGTIPIYLGAPNIEEFAPGDNCFVNANNYLSPAELAAHIRDIDPAAFQTWRKQPLRDSFLKKMERLEISWQQKLAGMLERRLAS